LFLAPYAVSQRPSASQFDSNSQEKREILLEQDRAPVAGNISQPRPVDLIAGGRHTDIGQPARGLVQDRADGKLQLRVAP
jgi:hypothetical protein